jgi:hypothetical protein
MKEEEKSIPLDLMELSCSSKSEVKRELGDIYKRSRTLVYLLENGRSFKTGYQVVLD